MHLQYEDSTLTCSYVAERIRHAAKRRPRARSAANAACNEKNTVILLTVCAYESNIDCAPCQLSGHIIFDRHGSANESAPRPASDDRAHLPPSPLNPSIGIYSRGRANAGALHNYRETRNSGDATSVRIRAGPTYNASATRKKTGEGPRAAARVSAPGQCYDAQV